MNNNNKINKKMQENYTEEEFDEGNKENHINNYSNYSSEEDTQNYSQQSFSHKQGSNK